MAQIVNNDKLTYILTNHGLDRVAAVLENPNLSIVITKIKVGDANGEYYEPTEEMTELKSPITGGEFPVIEKALLEDGLTVSFRVIIPESFGGCDIREIGIYETIDDVDYLFALGTQQPFVKPSTEDDYFISIDYYAFLKSQNLAEAYDRIYLDPDTGLVTELDLEDLMSTVLFSQSNLMDQIGHNSYTIGLNRASQLAEKIEGDRQLNSSSIMYNNYCNIEAIEGVQNIFSFWLFDYPRKNLGTTSITDLGPRGVNLDTNKNINLYNRKYLGVTPVLDFTNDNYYSLNKEFPLSFLNEEGTEDISFTIVYCIEPVDGSDRTIIARSNYASGTNVFEIKETANRQIYIRLFSNSENYITFTSGENIVPDGKHSVVISYDAYNKDVVAFINGDKILLYREIEGNYTHMNNSLTTLYGFSATPLNVIYADSSTSPTKLYSEKGAPNTNPLFTTNDGAVFYKSEECTYDSSRNVVTPNLYAYSYGFETIYIEDTTISMNTVLYNSNHSLYAGSLFKLAQNGTEVIIQYAGYSTERDVENDIEGTEIFAWKYEGNTEFIWTNSSTEPTVLYESNGNTYEGENWSIVGTQLYYNSEYEGVYTSTADKNIPFVKTTSYITNINNEKIDFINSYVGILGIAKTYLSTTSLRRISMLLTTALGETSCIIVS